MAGLSRYWKKYRFVNIFFYQCETIDNWKKVLGPVSQSSAESDYNAGCIAGMSLTQFITINNEIFNKYIDAVP